MTKTIFVVFIISVTLSSCKKEVTDNNSQTAQEDSMDALDEFENLGKWEIQARLVNNISDTPALCCEFVEFTPDANTNDSLGQFTYTSSFDSIVGTFAVSQSDSLHIYLDNDTHVRYFEVHENTLNLRYTENGDSIDEIWGK